VAVAFNNAARQLSLAGATGFSGRKQLGPPDAAAPHLEKPGAQVLMLRAGPGGGKKWA